MKLNRYLSSMALTLCLAACGEGGSSSQAVPVASAAPAASAPAAAASTVAARVTALEQSGELPNLDRSSVVVSSGVRPDIARWVDAQPVTPAQKTALSKLALATQQTLNVLVADDAALRATAAQQHAAIKCVIRRQVGQIGGKSTIKTLSDYTANTPERARAARNYANALNGSVFKSPEGDGCAN